MSQPPTFDLQSHSLHSDGALPAAEVVAIAHAAGVELLALSDHDTVAGVREADDEARRLGLKLVSAVEISAVYAEHGGDLHILGYGIDDRDPTLRDRLDYYRSDRERRSVRMARTLSELGYAVDQAVLDRRIAEGKPVGRPHLAQAVVGHPDNRERLTEEGLLEPSDFLVAYLIEGKPAFAQRESPTVAESIETIHDAGGVAIWAHPFWDIKDPGDVLTAIDRFAEDGIEGVECFYVTHTEEETQLLVGHCEQRGMLTTGSSDFHGPEHPHFSRFRAFPMYELSATLGPISS